MSFDDRYFDHTACKRPMFTLDWKINQFDPFVDHTEFHMYSVCENGSICVSATPFSCWNFEGMLEDPVSIQKLKGLW